MRTREVLASAFVALTLLTSCGGASAGPNATPERSVPPTQGTSSARPTPSADGFGTRPQLRRPSGPYDLVPEDVRVTEHDGRDRVVVRFAGRGMPGWSVRYVRKAVLEGSGNVVEVEGNAILRLDVSGTPTQVAGSSSPVPTQIGGDVVDLYVVGAFEGAIQVFVGLRDGRTPFRVSTRSSPSRLVVDLER